MRTQIVAVAALLALSSLPASAQETPAALTRAYASLADTILDLRQAEADLVRAILDGHLHAANAAKGQSKWEAVAAHMALFANEGDNGVGGVRKRLLEGGHHFNAQGEDQGIYEPGYVIVTKKAKRQILAASAAFQQAKNDGARMTAWNDFEATAKELLATK
jgi:hypothetical protein